MARAQSRTISARTISARKTKPKTIVLYPEAAFGPALNCVGIAQKLRALLPEHWLDTHTQRK